MKKYEFLGQMYTLVECDKNCFRKEQVDEKITDYFLPFDYIFGDYAYDKLRLKGFYKESDKNVKPYNSIAYLNTYKKEYCAYGANTFLLKKEN